MNARCQDRFDYDKRRISNHSRKLPFSYYCRREDAQNSALYLPTENQYCSMKETKRQVFVAVVVRTRGVINILFYKRRCDTQSLRDMCYNLPLPASILTQTVHSYQALCYPEHSQLSSLHNFPHCMTLILSASADVHTFSRGVHSESLSVYSHSKPTTPCRELMSFE